MVTKVTRRPASDWKDVGYPWLERPTGFIHPSKLSNLAAFREHWKGKGTRVIWIFLPYEATFRAAFAARFGEDHRRFKAEVTRIFEGDVLDLEAERPSEEFYDSTHLGPEGGRRLTLEAKAKLAKVFQEAGLEVPGN